MTPTTEAFEAGLRAEFEAWKRTQIDQDAWSAVLWATERAAKQECETEEVFLWCVRNLTERANHEIRTDPSNGVMRAWEAIRNRAAAIRASGGKGDA